MKIPANTVITVTHLGKTRHLLAQEPWDTKSESPVRCIESFPGRTNFKWTYVIPDFCEVTEIVRVGEGV